MARTIMFRLLALSALSFAPAAAYATCGPGDYVCEKFSRKVEAPKAVRKAPAPKAKPEAADVATTEAGTSPIATGSIAPDAAAASLPKSMTVLPPGTIQALPREKLQMVLAQDGQVEQAMATCTTVAGSDVAVLCDIALSRIALTTGAGQGCLSTFDLKSAEFRKREDGRWLHEEAIALCGGTLHRTLEWLAVDVAGQRRYGLREGFRFAGGDAKCAIPYLQGRGHRAKTYLPAQAHGAHKLSCGDVTVR